LQDLNYIKPTSLNLFCKGDNQVLEHLHKVLVSELQFVAYRFVKCESEAEDVVADCFEKLLKMPNDRRMLKFISNKINIKALLLMMVRNQSLDVLKINKNRSRILENLQKEFPNLELDESLTNTTQSNFNSLLATLNVKEKTVLTLVIDGFTKEEIVNQMGISKKTVSNLLSIARKKVKKNWKKYM
jgi:RNA polymerase sigma factor (sigma-70 family)